MTDRVSAKVAALQRNGCNDNVSWSKNGSIAYIGENKCPWVLTLICEDGENWKFSDPICLESKPETSLARQNGDHRGSTSARGATVNGVSASSSKPASRSVPIVHVCWNTGGTELACIDAQGDISIYSVASHNSNGLLTCLLDKSPGNASTQQTTNNYELNGVVGFRWFDIDKAILLPSQAVINANAYKGSPPLPGSGTGGYNTTYATYGVTQAKLPGPHNPVPTKFSCIAVTKRGVLRLISQIPTESRYYEVTTPLDDTSSNTELISHASFKGCRDDSLLLTTFSSDTSIIRVYKITINWSIGPEAKNGQVAPPNRGGGGATTEFANMTVKRLLKTVLSPSSPNPLLPVNGDDGEKHDDAANGTNGTTDNVAVNTKTQGAKYLTHLFLVPTYPILVKSEQGQSARPSSPGVETEHELYAVFSSLDGSIVHRFEIANRPVSLHPSFYSLSAQRRDSVPTNEESVTSITLYDTYATDKPILNIGSTNQEMYIYWCRSDGVVDLRRRQPTQNHLKPQPSKVEISTLFDAGYIYTSEKEDPDQLYDVALSPNVVSYVYLDSKSEPHIKYMENPNDYGDTTTFVNSVVGLAMRVAVACFGSIPSDDVSYIAKCEIAKVQKHHGTEMSKKFLYMLLQESFRANNFTVNIPRDYPSEKVFVNPSLQRLLSLQLSLATGKNWTHSAMAQISWCTLNLRLVSFAITFTLRAVSSKQQSGTPDFEVKASHIHSLTGLIRWITDFLALVCQELYMASLDESGSPYTEGSVSIPMATLLGRIPRVLLLYCLRATRGLEQIIGKLAEQENNVINGSMQAAFKKFRDTISHSPVSLTSFEKLVFDIDNSLKNMSTSDNADIEQGIMFYGSIPSQYLNVCKRTVEMFKKNLRSGMDIPQLYYYDVTWLSLTPLSEESERGSTVQTAASSSPEFTDVIRKSVLSRTDPATAHMLRKCGRCGSLSIWEEIRSPTNVTWAVAFQRNCLCGGNWYIPTDD